MLFGVCRFIPSRLPGGKAYSVGISQNGVAGSIRIDGSLRPYIESDFFVSGRTANIIAPVGQYKDIYQLVLALEEDLTYTE